MSSYDEAILAAKALSSKKGLDIQIIKLPMFLFLPTIW